MGKIQAQHCFAIHDDAMPAPVQHLAEREPAHLRDLGWVVGDTCCVWRWIGMFCQEEGLCLGRKSYRGIDAREKLPAISSKAGFFA